jgi:hypothetical protein
MELRLQEEELMADKAAVSEIDAFEKRVVKCK